jgi:hypothetical protein
MEVCVLKVYVMDGVLLRDGKVVACVRFDAPTANDRLLLTTTTDLADITLRWSYLVQRL